MRSIMTVLIGITLFALPAAAGSRYERDHDRNNRHDRHDTVVRHRVDHRMVELSRELERSAHRAFKRAVKTNHRPGREAASALRALDRLDRRSRRLNDRIERGYVPTAHDLKRVERAYYTAKSRLHCLRHTGRFEKDFRSAGHKIDRLERRVARRSDRRDHYAKRDRYVDPWFRAAFAWRD